MVVTVGSPWLYMPTAATSPMLPGVPTHMPTLDGSVAETPAVKSTLPASLICGAKKGCLTIRWRAENGSMGHARGLVPLGRYDSQVAGTADPEAAVVCRRNARAGKRSVECDLVARIHGQIIPLLKWH